MWRAPTNPRLIALALAGAGLAHAQYVIGTLAGDGPPQGSIATSYALSEPSIVYDSVNQFLYVSSASCNCVYRVSDDGFAQMVVGNASRGYGGNGQQAGTAMLSGPFGLALDSAGNLYIADMLNNVIRKVAISNGTIGNITTVAGNGTAGFTNGLATTTAQLNQPQSVAVDSSGNIYIADTGNNAIRVVSAGANPAMITLPTPGLNFPTGVAVDAAGNVYIADADNNEVKEYTGGPTLTVVAGTGTQGFNGDGAATSVNLWHPEGLMLSGNSLYIGDTFNQRVRVVNLITHQLTTLAGNGILGNTGAGLAVNAELGNPNTLALDGSGNLYIAEFARIEVVNANNRDIGEFAGNGNYGASGDNGPAVNSQLFQPAGVAVDSVNGLVYIADTFNERIRMINLANNTITTVAGSGQEGYSGPGPMPATSAQLNDPFGVALDAMGNLYIADTYNHVVEMVTINPGAPGNLVVVAGNNVAGYNGDSAPGNGITATTAELNYPSSIAFDSAGNLYIADTINNRIREVNLAANTIRTLAGNETQGFQDGAAASAEFFQPNGVAVGPDGTVYVADTFNGRIRAIANGVVTTIAGGPCCSAVNGDGGPALNAQLGNPYGVAVDGNSNLYIAETNGYQSIRKVAPNLQWITTIAGDGASGFAGDGQLASNAGVKLNRPYAVALDAAGDVYVADYDNNRIRKLTPVPTTLTSINPSTAAAGSVAPGNTLALSLAGNNFVPGDLVVWQNAATLFDTTLQTTFVDSQHLTALVPANLLSAAGTATVFVDVFGGGGTLPGSTFTITPSAVTVPADMEQIAVADTPTVIAFGPSTVPPAAANSPYSPVAFMASGGAGGFTVTASNLPPGMTFINGVLAGTPSVAGTYNVTITFTDSAGHAVSEIVVVSVNVSVVESIAVTDTPTVIAYGPLTVPPAVADAPYSPVTFTASGGSGGFTVTASNLPPGMTFINGVLAGTPSVAGTYNVTITFTDSAGHAVSEIVVVSAVISVVENVQVTDTVAVVPFIPVVVFGTVPSMTADGNGNYVVSVMVTNNGNVTVQSLTLNFIQLGAAADRLFTFTSPTSFQNIAPGASVTFTATVPMGKSGRSPAQLTVAGTYTAGALAGNWNPAVRVALPPSVITSPVSGFSSANGAITVSVKDATPLGTVKIMDDAATVGTFTADATGSLANAAIVLAVGNHSLTAVDETSNTTSAAVSVTITQ